MECANLNGKTIERVKFVLVGNREVDFVAKVV
jgi:hypothetical protein